MALVQRPTRFDLNASLSFKADEDIVEGHCVNVSASGMLAVFNQPVELFTVGEISMLIGEYYINITGRVARVLSNDHGIAFLIDNDSDRLTAKVLVDFAAAQHQPEGLT